MKTVAWMLVGVMLFTAAEGRTVVLADREITHVGLFHPAAPHSGWAGYEVGTGIFSSVLTWISADQGMVIRYALESVPAGNRIVNAELIMPVYSGIPAGAKLTVWRLLKDYGWGVSHQYRTTRPERVEWSVPGARGNGVDRATTPTIVFTPPRSTMELRVNVTQDVQLWYSNAAPNNGWLLTGEHGATALYLYSPLLNTPDSWKLRITYEPL